MIIFLINIFVNKYTIWAKSTQIGYHQCWTAVYVYRYTLMKNSAFTEKQRNNYPPNKGYTQAEKTAAGLEFRFPPLHIQK